MKHYRVMTLVVLLCIGLSLVPAVGANGSVTRYVAPNGEDSGDCVLPSSPCRTIQ